MAQYRKSTIKDVAAQAGVSTTTVSVFVSGRAAVCSPETAERIKTAIRTLHYTPSSLTQGLRQRATRTIGICLWGGVASLFQFGYGFEHDFLRGVMAEADERDYSLLYYPASVRDSTSCDAFLDGRVDCVLYATPDGNTRKEKLVAAGLPVVSVWQSEGVPSGCGFVDADERDVVHLALSHLWDLGHRRIAHLPGPVALRPEAGVHNIDTIARQRFDAYRAWQSERGGFDPALTAEAQTWEAGNAREALTAWRGLPEPPTAVFCANDTLALSALTLAPEFGWSVPETLSVVGVDNVPMAGQIWPGLTTVEVPVEQVGREAVRAVLALLDGRPADECRVVVPVSTLIVRGSTSTLSTFYRKEPLF